MDAGDVEVAQPDAFPSYDDRRVHGLVRDTAIAQDMRFSSCLDIGCGRSRYDKWFQRLRQAEAPHRYIGLDSDERIVAELQAEGVEVHRSPEGVDCRSDLTLCVEVIEHVLPEDSDDFFRFVAANTNKVVALTTPNFEYWQGSNFRALPELRECRWLPDHVRTWNPKGGPHAHKQWMTAGLLDDYFTRLVPRDRWAHQVYRAWPWRLTDVTTDQTFELHFKLFAVAWRTDSPAG
jgi:hypothetical protein